MDRRKRILANQYELATDAALKEAASRCGARVFPKVRIADALDIQDSGINEDEYSYALRAHFDFVVERERDGTAFAVEFDGPRHDTDLRTIARDGLKNSICEKLGMPLLRVDADYLRRIGKFSLLGWLAEVWYCSVDFDAAQSRGEVPFDEPFCWWSVMDTSDGRLTPAYDFSLDAALFIHRCWESGLCTNVGDHLSAVDPRGLARALRFLPLSNDRWIIGSGRCRAFRFPPVPPWELAEELATLDAAEKLKRHLAGQHPGRTSTEVAAWRNRFAGWKQPW